MRIFHKANFSISIAPVLLVTACVMLGACTQSGQGDDIEKRIADADARTEAAERRLKLATQNGSPGNGALASRVDVAKPQDDQPIDGTVADNPHGALADGEHYAESWSRRSGPTHDEP